MVLGRHGGALPKFALPIRLGVGAVLGSGQQWLPWIHLDDLVRMILFAVDHPNATGAINAVAPDPVTNETFTRALARSLHRPAYLRISDRLIRAALGELSGIFLAGQNVWPQKALSLGFLFRWPSLDDALADIYGHTAHQRRRRHILLRSDW